MEAVPLDSSYPLHYSTFEPLPCILPADDFPLFPASSDEEGCYASRFRSPDRLRHGAIRSHQSLRLDNMALRHRLAVYHHTVERPRLRPAARLYWPWLSRRGRPGNRPWNLCSPAPSSPGRKISFGITGAGLVRAASQDVPPLPKKSATSSGTCGKPTPHRALRASWVSYVCSASQWPNPRWRKIDRDSGRHRIEEVKIVPRSPWQNPYCERVIGSIHSDVLDHVIRSDRPHVMRLLRASLRSYHRFRPHL
jgi:hypothetical protein